MKAPREPRIESRKLKDLRPYPRQKEFFNDLSDEDLAGLAAAVKAGVAPPIEILSRNRAGLPVNTVLRGHQRLRAAKLSEITELTVKVRYDLAEADAAAIEREFLVDNQHRRHQDTLSRARVALRLVQLEQQHPNRPLTCQGAIDARDRVGRTIGMSGRNLQRYMKILETPLAVQEAFRSGKLSLVLAAKIGCLPERKQTEVADRIANGEDPAMVARDTFAAPKKRPPSAFAAIAALADAIHQGEAALLNQNVGVGDVRRRETALRRGKALISRLLSIVDNWDCAVLHDEECLDSMSGD